MLAYDENGDLREYEEDEGIVICKHCKRAYLQCIEEQVPGFRDIAEDVCPYCHESNNWSSDVEFYNKPLSRDEVKRL